jgi:hypothetical protein
MTSVVKFEQCNWRELELFVLDLRTSEKYLVAKSIPETSWIGVIKLFEHLACCYMGDTDHWFLSGPDYGLVGQQIPVLMTALA